MEKNVLSLSLIALSISLFVLLRVQLKATRMWFSNVRVPVLFFLSHAKLLQMEAPGSSPLLSRSLGTVSDGLLVHVTSIKTAEPCL